MDEQEHRRIALELQPGQPISGHIHRPGGTPESFHGWLELVTKLERLHEDQDDPPKNSHPPSSPDRTRA